MKTIMMRHFLVLPCLFVATFLLAQSKSQPYYQNIQEPPQQKALRADCYFRKFDAGTSAARRGDFRAALRLFEEAKKCPEATSNSRRIKELDQKIDYCNDKLGGNVKVSAEKSSAARRVENIELTARKFVRSAAFARNEDPNCFLLTMREADRAFRDSCWEDAAKLYRAAKSCADANQGDRERMSQRIEACDEAAKDELLQKEQKAIRTARHAIAANRADDAMDLLRAGDRSLAWRLADFANYYIAPDDNPDCLEAMYSAYFYSQATGNNKLQSPPFCYHLAANQQTGVQYKFYEYGGVEFLTAFIPNESRTITWELPSMKIVEGFSLDALKDPIGFDRAPDGGLLFYGTNYFYLPNGEKLDVRQVSKYCFSDDSRYFLYEDIDNGKLTLLNLELPIRAQQQRKNTSNIGRMGNVQTLTYPVNSGLLSMKSYKGEFWLGYRDRIEVLSPDKTTGSYFLRMTWNLADSVLMQEHELSMYLFPESRELILGTLNDVYYYFLHLPLVESDHESVVALNKISGRLLTCTAGSKPLLAVTTNVEDDNDEELMTVHRPAEKSISTRFVSNGALSVTQAAAISPSGEWIVVKGGDQRSRLWSLRDTSVSPPANFETGFENQVSPDGNQLYVLDDNLLKVFDFDDLNNGAQQEIPVLAGVPIPEGLANGWAVYRCKDTSISIQNLHTKQVLNFEVDPLENGHIPYAFDFEEASYFAYSPSQGFVSVHSLTGGEAIASRDLGGTVMKIRSIPGTDKLLIVTKVEQQFAGIRYTVKVWDFSKPGENPQIVRLKDYNVLYARVSDQGDRIALSNADDIRLFLVENLDNEAVVIKPPQNTTFYDIAFRPDGLALVSGDEQGKVSIWDVTTGQALLQFSNVWSGQKHQVDRLAFAYGGTRLRLVSPNRLFTANLDAFSLRDVVQSGERRLTSFSSEQIRAYNLEIAFKYPGNFDRLAQSEDFPLILSFFQYFRDQSISSNNIEQVSTYCQRASTLYELLDGSGKKNTEATMLEMLGDYTLKLLLRNNPAEAERVVAYMENRFEKPNIALLNGAHTALVKHDLNAASALYTDYLLRISGDTYFNLEVTDINTKLSQFQEYDLLDSAQVNCICKIFYPFNIFEKLCAGENGLVGSKGSAQILAYKQIYTSLDSVAYWVNRSAKARVLERAYDLASTLPYPNPNVPKHPLDTVAVILASAYLSLGDFEQNSPKSPEFYQKAVNLLEKTGALNRMSDTAQLNRLAEAYLSWGKYLLAVEKPKDAVAKFNAALMIGKKLSAPYAEGTLGELMVERRVLSPVYLELSKANLLMGNAEEARKAYDIAADLLGRKISTTLLGHAALLESNDIEAFINYGSIRTAEDLGETLVQIEQMADLLPTQSARLKAFAPRLRDAFLANHPEISPDEATYWYSSFQTARYGALSQWNSALDQSNIATKSMDMLMAKNRSEAFRPYWIRQRINQAYYLLFAKFRDTSALSEVIGYSLDALNVIDRDDPYSILKSYVYTNLAHAYWLRNKADDRKKAVETYLAHLNSYNSQDDAWELLLKDFRDLHRIGLNWPDFKNLIEQIKPEGVTLSPEDWRDIEQ